MPQHRAAASLEDGQPRSWTSACRAHGLSTHSEFTIQRNMFRCVERNRNLDPRSRRFFFEIQSTYCTCACALYWCLFPAPGPTLYILNRQHRLNSTSFFSRCSASRRSCNAVLPCAPVVDAENPKCKPGAAPGDTMISTDGIGPEIGTSQTGDTAESSP